MHYAGRIGILVRSFKQLWIKRSPPSYLSFRVVNVAISTVVRECSIAQKLNHQQPLLQQWMRWKLFCSCDAKDVHKIIFGIKWQTIIIVFWRLNWMKLGKVFSFTGNMMDNRVRLKLHMWFSIIWDKSRWAENNIEILSSSSWLGWVCWDMLEYARDRERQQRQPAGESPTLNSHNLVTAPISCLFLSDPGPILVQPHCQWLC